MGSRFGGALSVVLLAVAATGATAVCSSLPRYPIGPTPRTSIDDLYARAGQQLTVHLEPRRGHDGVVDTPVTNDTTSRSDPRTTRHRLFLLALNYVAEQNTPVLKAGEVISAVKEHDVPQSQLPRSGKGTVDRKEETTAPGGKPEQPSVPGNAPQQKGTSKKSSSPSGARKPQVRVPDPQSGTGATQTVQTQTPTPEAGPSGPNSSKSGSNSGDAVAGHDTNLAPTSATGVESPPDCKCESWVFFQPICRLFCPLSLLKQLLVILAFSAVFGLSVWLLYKSGWFKSNGTEGIIYPSDYDFSGRREGDSPSSQVPAAPIASNPPSPSTSQAYPLRRTGPIPEPQSAQSLQLQPLQLVTPPQLLGSQPPQNSTQACIDSLRQQVEDLAAKLARTERSAEEKLGSTAEVAAVVEVLQPSRAASRVAGKTGTAPNTEELLLSATAYYLRGSCKKTDLTSLLGELNVQCSLMIHENIDKFLADPGATRVDFVRSDQDGCWLWSDSGSGKSLGIPIDANIFRIRPAPALLARLCEGVTPGIELQITRVVRPCYFQREVNSKTFQLISRGVIQTAGSQASVYSQPRDFSTLRSLLKPLSPSLCPSSLAAAVKGQLELARERILALERGYQESNSVPDRLGRLESFNSVLELRLRNMEEAAALQTLRGREVEGTKPNLNGMAIQINNLGKAAKEKDDRIQALEAAVREMSAQLKRLLDVGKSDLSMQSGAVVTPNVMSPVRGHETEGSPLFSERVVPQVPFAERIASQSAAEFSTSRNPIAKAVSSVPPLPPLRKDKTGSNLVSPPTDAEPQFPDGWQQALATAPDKADPDPAVHVAAILGLFTRLKRLPGLHPIHVVHAVESLRRIQVHFAEASGDQIRCQCGVSKPFSFAICAGEKGSRRLPLVFPAGSYSGSNDPAGYSALISGFRGEAFTIQSVEVPAILQQLPGGGPDEYTAPQQMRIAQPQ